MKEFQIETLLNKMCDYLFPLKFNWNKYNRYTHTKKKSAYFLLRKKIPAIFWNIKNQLDKNILESNVNEIDRLIKALCIIANNCISDLIKLDKQKMFLATNQPDLEHTLSKLNKIIHYIYLTKPDWFNVENPDKPKDKGILTLSEYEKMKENEWDKLNNKLSKWYKDGKI